MTYSLMTAARLAWALSLAGALGCGAATKLSPSSDAMPAPDGMLSSDGADGVRVSDGPADTSDAGPACLTGKVSFTFRAAPGSPQTYCQGAPGSCAGTWLSILAADGSELSLVYGCVPDCSHCQPVSCPLICAVPTPFDSAGEHMSWDGTFVEHLTCGASIACTHSACAPAGNYVARMCVYAELPAASSGPPTTCEGTSNPTCVDVPFVWPPPSGASSVEGVIPVDGADSGASD